MDPGRKQSPTNFLDSLCQLVQLSYDYKICVVWRLADSDEPCLAHCPGCQPLSHLSRVTGADLGADSSFPDSLLTLEHSLPLSSAVDSCLQLSGGEYGLVGRSSLSLDFVGARTL